jgi:hypothetical protein
MKTIKFTQTVTVTVTVEAEVPLDWDDADIQHYADNCELNFTVNESDSWYEPEDDEPVITSLSLDSADTTEATVEENK